MMAVGQASPGIAPSPTKPGAEWRTYFKCWSYPAYTCFTLIQSEQARKRGPAIVTYRSATLGTGVVERQRPAPTCEPVYPLLERAPFLASLRALLDEAGAGQGRLLFLGGEAGGRKSAPPPRLFAGGGPGAAVFVWALGPPSDPPPPPAPPGHPPAPPGASS